MILEEILSVQFISYNSCLLPCSIREGCYCMFLVKAEFVPQTIRKYTLMLDQMVHIWSHKSSLCSCYGPNVPVVHHSLSWSQQKLNIDFLQGCFVGFHDICAGVSLCEDCCRQQFLGAHLKTKSHSRLLCLSPPPFAFVIYHLTLRCLCSLSQPHYKLPHFTFLWTGAKLSLMTL